MHKLTLVEAERVMAVLSDTEERLMLSCLIPLGADQGLAEQLASDGFGDAAHALRWLWKAETSAAMARERRQNLRNVLRIVNSDVKLKEALSQHAVRSSAAAEEDGVEGEGVESDGSPPLSGPMQEFLSTLDEHKKITVRKLSTTAEDAQLRKTFTEEVAQREKKLKDDYKELSDELELLKQQHSDEITVLDKSIRKLQGELNSIQSLIRKEESSLAEEKRQKSAEAENSYKENSTALNTELEQLKGDLDGKVQEFSSVEGTMQKNKVKGQLNLREIVEKYDTDMMELQAELDRTQAVYDAEQKELGELTEYFTKWDAERARIAEEERLIAEENRKKAEAIKVLDDAASCIQKLFRGMKWRKENKKGKKKKGKKKKGKKKK